MILLICQERRDSEFRLDQRKCDVMCIRCKKKKRHPFSYRRARDGETHLGMKFASTTFPTRERCVASGGEID